MKRGAEKREGHGYLIDWIIRIGDLIILNVFFSLLYYYTATHSFIDPISYAKKLEVFLVINGVYAVTALLVRLHISSNIIYYDKIIERTAYFISVYWVLLTVAFSIFGLTTIPVIPWIFGFIALGTLFSFWHVIFRSLLKTYRKKGYNYKNIVIVGGGLNGMAIFQMLTGNYYGYRIIGFFDDNAENKDMMPNYLGKVEDLAHFLEESEIDELYCALLVTEEEKIRRLISLCDCRMIRFYLVPEIYKYLKRQFKLRTIGDVPVMTLRYEPLEFATNRFIKRTFDIVVSSLTLVTLFPIVYVVFGLGIKWSSPGPIFFKQKRTGFKGQEFYCYKFRSMQVNNDANNKSATKCDPRVTKIGQFMRKTSVDELPQFINVIKGDMSVVGPRPHMLKHTVEYSELIEKFMVRHLVKPGITGWAQVTGFRGETKVLDDMEGRVKKDVWYIENWTFFLDIKIIVTTITNVFKGEDKAY